MLDKCAGTAVDHIIRSGNAQMVYVGMSPVSNALLQAHASVKYQRYLRYVCGLDDRQFGKGRIISHENTPYRSVRQRDIGVFYGINWLQQDGEI